MNWYSVGLAAAAGALAAVVAALLVPRRTERKVLYIVTFALVFSVSNELARAFILPTLTIPREMEKLERELLQLPVFQAIKQYDPAIYHALMIDLESGLRSGKSENEVTNQIRPRIEQLAQRRLPMASDPAVVTYVSVTTRQMRDLRRQDPLLCYQFLFPQQYGAVASENHMTNEFLEAAFSALADVIKTSAESPQSVPTQEEVSEYLAQAIAELQKAHEGDIAVLQNLHAPDVDMAIGCDVVADLYDVIIALPPAQNGKLLRYLMNQG